MAGGDGGVTGEGNGSGAPEARFFDTAADFRAWLEENHGSATELWVGYYKKGVPKQSLTYPESVEEALCFGWIDSTVNILDDDRGLQLLTPRKAKSGWTRLNRQRAADMDAAGLMHDAGRRAIVVAQENGWWTIYDPVEDLIEPDPLARALDADAAARVAWDAFPPSARKMMLWWVVSAAKDETRDRRIATIVAKAAKGERAQG